MFKLLQRHLFVASLLILWLVSSFFMGLFTWAEYVAPVMAYNSVYAKLGLVLSFFILGSLTVGIIFEQSYQSTIVGKIGLGLSTLLMTASVGAVVYLCFHDMLVLNANDRLFYMALIALALVVSGACYPYSQIPFSGVISDVVRTSFVAAGIVVYASLLWDHVVTPWRALNEVRALNDSVRIIQGQPMDWRVNGASLGYVTQYTTTMDMSLLHNEGVLTSPGFRKNVEFMGVDLYERGNHALPGRIMSAESVCKTQEGFKLCQDKVLNGRVSYDVFHFISPWSEYIKLAYVPDTNPVQYTACWDDMVPTQTPAVDFNTLSHAPDLMVASPLHMNWYVPYYSLFANIQDRQNDALLTGQHLINPLSKPAVFASKDEVRSSLEKCIH